MTEIHEVSKTMDIKNVCEIVLLLTKFVWDFEIVQSILLSTG